MPGTAEGADQATTQDFRAINVLEEEVREVLDGFDGEESVKRLFWEVLSYDRDRTPLRLSMLLPPVAGHLTSLEVFASSTSMLILYAGTRHRLDHYTVERLCRSLRRRMPQFVLLLHDLSPEVWTVVYLDEAKKRPLRLLRLPGPIGDRASTARALAALSSVDPDTDRTFTQLEVADILDVFFPGEMPRTNVVLDGLQAHTEKARPRLKQIAAYIEEISRFPLLTHRQERGDDLFGERRPPDGSKMDYRMWRLVVHNLRLAVFLALKIPRVGMELEDLIQEGSIGLIMAAQRYDPARGARFATYAYYWIRQKMMRALYTNWSLIRWPVYKASELVRANLAAEARALPYAERALMGWNGREPLSVGPFDRVQSGFDVLKLQALMTAVGTLTDRQKTVVQLRYGLDGARVHTLREIGDQLGISRERVRQIEMQALERLRHRLPK